ncbi:MAG: purine-nucleoside phosphorylase [Defluviitaleaceae bacterium]|nr:purine-nucleoside phosphorylase [Defluviitaleaceae bacterium]
MIPARFYHESAGFLRQRLSGFAPELLLILGSGLGSVAEKIEGAQIIPYGEIPYFKKPTVPGHKGRLVAGRLSGRRVLAMQGRFHVYEGHTPEESAFPVRVANLLGAKAMIATCAAGGVNENYNTGEFAVLTDFINLTGASPLQSFNIIGFKTRFVDMTRVFDESYRAAAIDVANSQGLTLREGVYFYMTGPQFETPSEIRAIRALGGDLVGMSTVHECVMARRCGMRVAGIALISNMAAGVLGRPISEGEVFVEAHKASEKFSAYIVELISRLE